MFVNLTFAKGHPAMLGGLFGAIGNPLSDGTWTYTWEKGRQLKRMQSVDVDASFVYNENGLRIQKTVNGVVTKYTLHGKNIVHMTQGNDTLHFYYDATNRPAMVEYNGVKYTYIYNLQSDVVALLDSNGTAVVKYRYDAWGKPTSKTGDLASTLGTVQPFRYRSYVLDEDTGLYYLRSRYYASTTARFLNIDSCIATSFLSAGLNAFAYCCNDPANQIDHDGCLIWPGEIHYAVQKHIIHSHPSIMMEVAVIKENGSKGRIDLFDYRTGEVWEVKPLSVSVYTALDQANSYVHGTIIRSNLAHIHKSLGRPMVGQFVYDSVEGVCYNVIYYSPMVGVIRYQYLPLNNNQTNSQPNEVFQPVGLFDGLSNSNQFPNNVSKPSSNSNIVHFPKKPQIPSEENGQAAAIGVAWAIGGLGALLMYCCFSAHRVLN